MGLEPICSPLSRPVLPADRFVAPRRVDTDSAAAAAARQLARRAAPAQLDFERHRALWLPYWVFESAAVEPRSLRIAGVTVAYPLGGQVLPVDPILVLARRGFPYAPRLRSPRRMHRGAGFRQYLSSSGPGLSLTRRDLISAPDEPLDGEVVDADLRVHEAAQLANRRVGNGERALFVHQPLILVRARAASTGEMYLLVSGHSGELVGGNYPTVSGSAMSRLGRWLGV